MALSLAQNAIALLIDLAERGEIDPWDVKVIEVIDRFLSQLTPLQSNEAGRAPYEADLSESGQAFLYASILVLLKADSLARSESRDEEEELEAEEVLAPEGTTALPLRLEKTIRRRAVANPPQNRRVTLKELIAQLEIMAATVAENKPRIRARRPRPQSRSQAVRAITQLAHQENLSEIAAALEQFLSDHWQDVSEGEEWVDFDVLLELWVHSDAQQAIAADPSAHHSDQSDRVGVFWALLFLSAQTKVELSQEKFYQDLRVRSLAHLTTEELANLSALILSD
ncbi:MAG: segregation/condensation protein A [Oculatellaceae cyanobacterium bins.114]|nr:segregation/condensation protein A [Oculatellaceae cyanobacterium bins.114]